MRVQFVPQKAELSLRNPENLILVENSEDSVVIRAARDNFSERKKVCFIPTISTRRNVKCFASTSGTRTEKR